MPKFVATTQAYVDDRLIEPGTVFDYPYRPGDWAVPRDEYIAAEAEEDDDGTPRTLNEAATGLRRGRPLGSKNKGK